MSLSLLAQDELVGWTFEAHPITIPHRMLLDELKLEISDAVIAVMSSAVGYLSPDPNDRGLPLGGFDAAFDFYESLGFNGEHFRGATPETVRRALLRQDDLAARRWRTLPIFSLGRYCGGSSDYWLPVGLSDFEHDSRTVQVTSAAGVKVVEIREFFAEASPTAGYIAAVPSVAAIMSPGRFDTAPAARRALRMLLGRMLSGYGSVDMLVEWLAGRPGIAELSDYRARLRQLSGGERGNTTWYRDQIVAAMEQLSTGSEEMRDAFVTSGALFGAFLAGEDSALAAAVEVEREALVDFHGKVGAHR